MTDLISRADAIEAVTKLCLDGYKAKVDGYFIPLTDALINTLSALPSAETHEIRTETHGVCLISKDDAMGAVQDHFNDNGFKGYDDGQKMMDRIKALPSAEGGDAEMNEAKSPYMKPSPNNGADLISRADAIEAVVSWTVEDRPHEVMPTDLIDRIKALPSADAVDVAHDIPEYCSWSQTYTNMVQSAMSKASAESVHKPDYSYEADMVRRLKKALSADAEQGEWLKIEDYNGDYHYQCSVCKDEFYLEYGTPKENGYTYCPSCGARMKGGAE